MPKKMKYHRNSKDKRKARALRAIKTQTPKRGTGMRKAS